MAFAREGAKVAIGDIDVDGGKETVNMIHESGGDALFTRTDVTDAEQVQSLVILTTKAYERLDYAFNNAGILGPSRLTVDLLEKHFDRLLSVNLKGVWLCMKYEIPQMLDHGKGVIVNTASIMGFIGYPRIGHYVASKHGVIGLTRTAAVEYMNQGIRVNAVCPTYIETPMITNAVSQLGPDNPTVKIMAIRDQAGFYGQPEQIAKAVIWLCSDAASLVNGHALVLDGGLLIGDHIGRYYNILESQGLITNK